MRLGSMGSMVRCDWVGVVDLGCSGGKVARGGLLSISTLYFHSLYYYVYTECCLFWCRLPGQWMLLPVKC